MLENRVSRLGTRIDFSQPLGPAVLNREWGESFDKSVLISEALLYGFKAVEHVCFALDSICP